MNSKAVLEKWLELFNQADVEGLADLHHEDAVNHQVANEPVVGRTAIRQMIKNEFDTADMVCIPENIFVDGEWAILEWKDPLDLRGCGFFHVVDGKIKFQRGYWDKLSFLKLYNLPIPQQP
jgi:limonene-1,2-epoxide hydrolase